MLALTGHDTKAESSPEKEIPAPSDPIFTDGERNQVWYAWNETYADFPDGCLHELFEQQAELRSSATAVVCEGNRLSYDDLNQRANHLAGLLRQQGVGPDVLVGLLVERSVEMIVGILGVLKAGGAYVPIDASFPTDRIAFIVGDAKIAHLVTQTSLLPVVPDGAALRVVTLDTLNWAGVKPQTPAGAFATPRSLAYVIYTSGSTGSPKGVCIEHRNIVNYVRGVSGRFRFEPGMNHATVSTIAADLGNTVIFPAFATGGCLHIISHACAESQSALSDYFRREQIDVLKIVPSHLAALQTGKAPELVMPRKRLILGGEASRLDWIEHLRGLSPSCDIFNHYGPTETTVGVLTYHVGSELPVTPGGTLPLGRPLPNSRIYIVDTDGRPVPIGEVGELCIGGAGVARGYLNHDDISAERFINDPFNPEAGGRLYKTGDRARCLPTGDIEFCGRFDYQVKIRGYRVELGEIESVLRAHAGVQEAVVTASEEPSGEQVLAGYVVPKVLRQPLWNNKAVYLLPDGSAVAHLNKNETDYIYNEIFVLQAYLRHGITIQDGDCIVDAGSNIGLFTVFASRLADNLRIFSFEPNSRAFACLKANAETWGTNVKCLPFGLSRENTSADMTVFEGFSLLSGFHADAAQERSVVEAFAVNQDPQSTNDTRYASDINHLLDDRFQTRTERAQLRTLSSVITEEGIDRIDLLKVNVEKSELDVLEGIRADHWSRIRQLVIEVDEQKNLETITGLLNRQGFETFVEQDPLLRGTDLCYVYAARPSLSGNRLVGGQSGESPARVIPLRRELGLTPLGLRKQLKDRLPQYMIPSSLVLLEKLPLNANGKLDRKALPDPVFESAVPVRDSVQPLSGTEATLVTIWKEILKLQSVGIHDDFFDLGGHSLLAIKAVSRIRDEFGVDLSAQALFETPTIAELAQVLSKNQSSGVSKAPRISRRMGSASSPLSFSQEPLWFLHQLDPCSPVYNIVDVVCIDGIFNADALNRAVRELVRRHEVLRTRFVENDEQSAQFVLPELEVPVAECDWTSLLESERERAWTDLVRNDGRKPFDLSCPPLLRATVAHCHAGQHRLLITIHHIIADEWSMEIIQRELLQTYHAFSVRQPSPLVELPIQYADFACWQREWLEGERLQEQLAFWKEELAGAPCVLDLPADKPRPSTQSFRGSTEVFTLPAELLEGVKLLARQEQATLFMALGAGFAALLHRYTSQDDILIGTPISNRTQSELESLVGCFLNTVVLRSQFTEGMSFRSLLQQMRGKALGAYEHSAAPFDRLVAEMVPERDASRSPLFQVMFVLHSPGGRSQVSKASGNHQLETGTAKFDLTLMLSESGGTLEGVIEYRTDLFTSSTIQRMCGHYATLVKAAVDDPDQAVSALPLLADPERRELLVEWNDTGAEYPKDVPLAKLVEEQVERTPENVAVVAADGSLTFRELNSRANQLARELCEHGAGPDQVVGVYAGRSTDLVVSLLAITKAGAAYLPLDPLFPSERLSYMLKDSGARLLVTECGLTPELPTFDGTTILLDDERWSGNHSDNLDIRVEPENLAYVLYTSGSTGKPKGVQVVRSALTNLLWSMRKWLQLGDRDRLLAVTTISFDIAGVDIWLPLIVGAQMVLASRESAADGRALRDLLERHDISFLQATPVTWQLLFEAGWQGKANLKVVCTGEAMPPNLAAQLVPAAKRVWNLYGPTETTIWSTGCLVTDGQQPILIGRPVANTQLYILDAQKQPVPIGVAGELYIGGDGVARGYLNRPGLTAEKFVQDPFRGGEARMYRTGDLARYRANGNVECMGRIDHQVKVRGFRIELGEIEETLKTLPGIKQAVVIAREDAPGDRRLVAYYTSTEKLRGAEQLRSHLSATLPEYMIPSAFVSIDSFPLTPNGKLDRKALLPPERDAYSTKSYLPPENETELMISAIWQDVLGVAEVGQKDNFFDLGGDSLRLLKAKIRLQKALGKDIPLMRLMEEPTVESLALWLQQHDARKESLLVSITPGVPDRPALFFVHATDGTEIGMQPFATSMNPEVPLYCLLGKGWDGSEPFATVEEAAGHYLAEIRSIQRHGPYYLAGFCFGGTVAFQMACMLENAGEPVGGLSMIDNYNPAFRRFEPSLRLVYRFAKFVVKRGAWHLRKLRSLPPGACLGYLQHHLNALYKLTRRTLGVPARQQTPDILGVQASSATDTPEAIVERMKDAGPSAARGYVPLPYGGSVTLFRTAQQFHDDIYLGWKSVVKGNIEVIEIDADHLGIFKSPAACQVAEVVCARLENQRCQAQNYKPNVAELSLS